MEYVQLYFVPNWRMLSLEEDVMAIRTLFLCAQGLSRAYLAASLLTAVADNRFDVWATPTQDEHGLRLSQQVLQEQGIAPIAADRLIQPTFEMRWDEGIVLCNGAADT